MLLLFLFWLYVETGEQRREAEEKKKKNGMRVFLSCWLTIFRYNLQCIECIFDFWLPVNSNWDDKHFHFPISSPQIIVPFQFHNAYI